MQRYFFTGHLFSSLKGKKYSLSIIAILSPPAPHPRWYHQRNRGFALPRGCTQYL